VDRSRRRGLRWSPDAPANSERHDHVPTSNPWRTQAPTTEVAERLPLARVAFGEIRLEWRKEYCRGRRDLRQYVVVDMRVACTSGKRRQDERPGRFGVGHRFAEYRASAAHGLRQRHPHAAIMVAKASHNGVRRRPTSLTTDSSTALGTRRSQTPTLAPRSVFTATSPGNPCPGQPYGGSRSPATATRVLTGPEPSRLTVAHGGR